jgi:hypothetical protein
LASFGVHGGAYTWKSHVFPFADAIHGLYIPMPIIGSIYPLTRGLFGTVQDINHPAYRSMVNTIVPVLQRHKNVVAVSGHDHSLQLVVKEFPRQGQELNKG